MLVNGSVKLDIPLNNGVYVLPSEGGVGKSYIYQMKPSNRKLANPFIYQGYESPEYFCDREAETATLLSHLKNGRNVTLISRHRIGKTGLIKKTFFYLEEEENDTVCLTELMFTDNDELSGLIARMWRMPASR